MNSTQKIDYPPLPEPWQGFQLNPGWKSWENVVRGAMDEPGVTQAFTAQQMRDYVAADRAQRQAGQEPSAWLTQSGALMGPSAAVTKNGALYDKTPLFAAPRPAAQLIDDPLIPVIGAYEKPLVRQTDEQAALAVRDAEIAALSYNETQLIGERDVAVEYGTRLADAVSAHFRVPVGEHSNMNDPRHEALSILDGAYITDSDEGRRIATLTAEIAALRQDKKRLDFLESSSNGTMRLDPTIWERDPMRLSSPIYIAWMTELGTKWPEAQYPTHRKTAREAIDVAMAQAVQPDKETK